MIEMNGEEHLVFISDLLWVARSWHGYDGGRIRLANAKTARNIEIN